MSFGETQLLEANRPLVTFTPSIWEDYFITNASELTETDNTLVIDELKKQVKKMFEIDVVQSSREMLYLVDAIQRLGLACHFETEIEVTLQKLNDDIDTVYADLYTVALRFRLLRQQGYDIPCDAFMKFKGREGTFKKSLTDDIQGMLSLYEASHLRCHGEEILDEAYAFTATHLKFVESKLSSCLSQQVSHALKHPIRKSMQLREARRYISAYEQEGSHNEVLLTFAKLEFNNLQLLYKKELDELTRWRRSLYSSTELLAFSRDRIVECFYWSLAVFYEAEYSLARTTLAKQIAVLSIIDDIYDSFGTLPELEIFTQAIERWDLSAIDELPEYMKVSYKVMMEFYDEVDHIVAEGRPYCIEYAKQSLLKQVRAYFHEAKWLHHKEIPSFDEYLPIGYESAGSFSMISIAFIGMENEATKESLDWVLSDPEPKSVRAMSVVGRLMNDLAYHKSQYRKSGRIVASAMECYIQQHGASEEEAGNEMTGRVASAWKDVNEECLKPAIPRRLAMRVLDLVRASDEMYRDGDGYTEDVLIKYMVESLIITPVPV